MKCPKCHFETPGDTRFCSNCGASLSTSKDTPLSQTKTLLEPTKELTIGTTFAGRYQIIEELGKGGMGKVYKALDLEIEEKVALKLLKPEIAFDKKMIQRFRNELKFARKIAHKNVCRMYDFSKKGETLYITMEYVPGEDLKSSMRRMGPLSPGKVIFITKQVCEGLAEAHRLEVIHRDLKPQNVMIDKEGNAHIMDFGIARSLKAKGVTGSGVMIGTPEYMSPEQVGGEAIDQRTDIYSLGVILFEMLTGRVPFEGDTPITIAVKHKTEVPPDPRELNDQIPENLCRMIMRCMEKDKEKRYQGVEELLSELNNIEKVLPTTESLIPKKKPATSKEITVQFKLNKILIRVLAFILVAIIAIIVWRFVPFSEILGTSSTPPVSLKKESLFLAGKKYWESKNYSEAIGQYKKILVMDPKDFKALLSLASVLKEQGKIDEAIPEYEKLIALDSMDPRPYKHLGEIFELKKDIEKALDYYKKYTIKSPKDSDFERVEQKVEGLVAQLRSKEKQEKKIVEPFKTEKKEEKKLKIVPRKITPVKTIRDQAKPREREKEKVDLSAKLDQGSKAFNRGDFDQCIKLMEETLEAYPKNTTAQYFLAEAKKRKEEKPIEQEMRSSLKNAQDAYKKGDYQECLNLIKKVLKFNPDNPQAREYLNLANQKIAYEQIKAIVSQYVQSLNNNNLLSFYKNTCSPEFYQEIKKDAELISHSYSNLRSEASNIGIRLSKETNRAEVSFAHTITGKSQKDKKEQELFKGIFKWDMERQGDVWKIIGLTAHPIEKR